MRRGKAAACEQRDRREQREGSVRALPLLLVAASFACGLPEPARTSTAWSAACPIDLEMRAAEPVHAWAACDAETGIPGCRRLVTKGIVTPDPRIRVSDRGEVEIGYGQRLPAGGGSPASKQWVWAGIEGDVRVRAVQHDSDAAACTYYVEDLQHEALRLGVRGDGQRPLAESLVDGLVEVDRDAALRVLFRNADREVSRWNGDLRRVAPDRRLERHVLDAPEASRVQVIHEPARDPDSLGVGAAAPFEIAGRVYFEVGDAQQRAILSWSAGEGVQAIRRYPASEGRAAGNLGSDGKVLVWSEGEGRDEDGRFARSWIVAAPVSKPEQARRVAPDVAPHVGAAPFSMGCGWAGHRVPGGALLVDLASGETMQLSDRPALRWGSVLAISCDEAFVTFAGTEGTGLARIPRRTLRARGRS